MAASSGTATTAASGGSKQADHGSVAGEGSDLAECVEGVGQRQTVRRRSTGVMMPTMTSRSRTKLVSRGMQPHLAQNVPLADGGCAVSGRAQR